MVRMKRSKGSVRNENWESQGGRASSLCDFTLNKSRAARDLHDHSTHKPEKHNKITLEDTKQTVFCSLLIGACEVRVHSQAQDDPSSSFKLAHSWSDLFHSHPTAAAPWWSTYIKCAGWSSLALMIHVDSTHWVVGVPGTRGRILFLHKSCNCSTTMSCIMEASLEDSWGILTMSRIRPWVFHGPNACRRIFVPTGKHE